MKIRYLLVLTLGIVWLMTSVCMASDLTNEQFNIGGVTPDSTPQEVEAIYGKPDKTEWGPTPYGDGTVYCYGDSFRINFVDNVAMIVYVNANNGISTSAGIHVGSTWNDVRGTYGQPKLITFKNSQTDKTEKNQVYYYVLRGNQWQYMEFVFDQKTGKVIYYLYGLMDGVGIK